MNQEKINARLQLFAQQGLTIPHSMDVSALSKPVVGDGFVAPNAFCIQPMEGCDGTAAGAPDELTCRRYDRFAKSGAGLIWAEATAVCNEGRANPRQLYLCDNTYDGFARLYENIVNTAQAAGNARPMVVLQLTHSGRFANYSGQGNPVPGWRHEALDGRYPKQAATPPTDDDTLRALPEMYAKATRLARRAGFDGVDVKCCHLYLFSELLSAYDRPGEYGGSFENRTRLLMDCVRAAASEDPGTLACRLNLYDGIAYGFGVRRDGSLEADFAEPARLIKQLADAGVRLINTTMGSPYYNPHVNRPYNSGGYTPPETPEVGVARLLNGAREAVQADERVRFVATGFTQLGDAAAAVAAGAVEQGWAHFVGLGRLSFACPDYPNHVFNNTLQNAKLCVACGKCTELMRAGSTAGCPIRDSVYTELYRRDVQGK